MRRLLLHFIFPLLALSLPVSAADSVVLSFGGYDHPMSMTAETILREAYASFGARIVIWEFPPERFMLTANQGSVDGILFGGEDISLKYPNLEKIAVPLGFDEVVVFTKKTFFTVSGPESLRPYSIGLLIGMPEIQKMTAGMRVEAVATPVQLFRKLDAGRTDIVVFPKLFGLKIIRELGLSSVRALPGTLDRLGLYHYLVRGNANLPAVVKALRAMERSGRIREVNRRMESELLR